MGRLDTMSNVPEKYRLAVNKSVYDLMAKKEGYYSTEPNSVSSINVGDHKGVKIKIKGVNAPDIVGYYEEKTDSKIRLRRTITDRWNEIFKKIEVIDVGIGLDPWKLQVHDVPSSRSGWIGEFRQYRDVKQLYESQLDSLQASGIVVRDSLTIMSYLSRHPDLSNVLIKLSNECLNRFEGSAQIRLDLYSDPEIDHEYLFLCIRQHDYDPSITEIIDNIYAENEYLLDNKSGWVQIGTDFQKPE